MEEVDIRDRAVMSLARVFVGFHATCHIYGKLRTLWIVDGQITMVIMPTYIWRETECSVVNDFAFVRELRSATSFVRVKVELRYDWTIFLKL